jgi:hypothetical protein
VNSTLHEELEALAATSVHVPELKVPLPMSVKLIEPAGALVVALEVSLTVTVHVVGVPSSGSEGAQVNFVVVDRFSKATELPPELGDSCASPE